jgi:hypothetical protein
MGEKLKLESGKWRSANGEGDLGMASNGLTCACAESQDRRYIAVTAYAQVNMRVAVPPSL